MTAQQYFNAHKGERMHAYDGQFGTIVGYHFNPDGFERLILATEFGWSRIGNFDFIESSLHGMKPTNFMYVEWNRHA